MITFSELKAILKNHQLRITDCRLDVLSMFIIENHALKQSDLEENLTQYDRVTLYRTLTSFTENGVLHKIPDDSGQATYGLCYETCSCAEHQHNHIHFKCNRCGNVECLDLKIPELSLSGYQIHEANFILNGICKGCGEV